MPLDQTEAIVLRTFDLGDQDKHRRLPDPGQGRPPGRGQGGPEVRQPVRQQPGAHVPRPGLLLREGAEGPRHGQQLRPPRVLLRRPEGPQGLVHPELFRGAHRGVLPRAERGRRPLPSPPLDPAVPRRGRGRRRSSPATSRPGSSGSTASCRTSARCKKCRKPLPARPGSSPKRDGAYCGECAPLKKDAVPPETGPFLEWVRRNPPPEACPPALEAGARNGIRKVLQALIVYHLEREPRTLRHLATGE